MTNEEKVKILLKYFKSITGSIDLSDIDFGHRFVHNSGQKARAIFNENQEAVRIYNDFQKANTIFNDHQEATEIYNDNQVIKPIYETMSKEQLIARIKELENE